MVRVFVPTVNKCWISGQKSLCNASQLPLTSQELSCYIWEQNLVSVNKGVFSRVRGLCTMNAFLPAFSDSLANSQTQELFLYSFYSHNDRHFLFHFQWEVFCTYFSHENVCLGILYSEVESIFYHIFEVVPSWVYCVASNSSLNLAEDKEADLSLMHTSPAIQKLLWNETGQAPLEVPAAPGSYPSRAKVVSCCGPP